MNQILIGIIILIGLIIFIGIPMIKFCPKCNCHKKQSESQEQSLNNEILYDRV